MNKSTCLSTYLLRIARLFTLALKAFSLLTLPIPGVNFGKDVQSLFSNQKNLYLVLKELKMSDGVYKTLGS